MNAALVDAILNQVATVGDELHVASLRPQLAACRRQVAGGGNVEVAVFGRFKAGKSSFLNHLAGRNVLPIGVVPLTAVITRLRYGAEERAEVEFLDGSRKPVALDEIHLYVAERENPGNQKGVAAVVVSLPTLKHLAPLELVDTPGIGSALVHNTEAALNWLPNVGAALLAVSADAPLSERDLALLEELRRHTPKIVILLTKADLLTAPQRNEVLAFVREQLARRFSGNGQEEPAPASAGGNGGAAGNNLLAVKAAGEGGESRRNGEWPVFFYSVRPEEGELHERLQRELLFPLIGDRGKAAREIARHKLVSVARQALNYLEVALAAASQADSARQALQENLAEERRQLDLLRAEFQVLAREWSAQALDWSLAQLLPVQEAMQARVTEELRAQFPRWRLRLPRLLEAWREWLRAFLNRELGEVSRTQRAMFCTPLHKTQRHLKRTLDAFRDRLAGHAQQALGVTLVAREFSLEVREPETPPVDVAFAFDVAFTTVGRLVPLTLFRRPVQRVLLRKARYEVEKNLSRLAADWRDRVAAGITRLIQQAEEQAVDELTTLEQLVANCPAKAPRLRALKDELEQRLRLLP
jgi:GTP-binding protein EngB required for normal cell division